MVDTITVCASLISNVWGYVCMWYIYEQGCRNELIPHICPSTHWMLCHCRCSDSINRFSNIQAHSSLRPAFMVGGGRGFSQHEPQRPWKISTSGISRSENPDLSDLLTADTCIVNIVLYKVISDNLTHFNVGVFISKNLAIWHVSQYRDNDAIYCNTIGTTIYSVFIIII